MSDQNTSDQATTATTPSATNNEPTAKLYPTKDEALANKPKDATKNHKPCLVSKSGAVVGWLWARGYDNALAIAARLDGYTVSLGGKAAPVTKEVVAAKLSEFTDDELAAMGLSRKPTRGRK